MVDDKIIRLKAELFDLQTQAVTIRVQIEKKMKDLNFLLEEAKDGRNKDPMQPNR